MLSREIVGFNQFKSITKVNLQFGADSGPFVDFYFKDGEYEEYTSIGACANYACKLQCKANDFELLISKSTLDLFDKSKQLLFSPIDSIRQAELNINKQSKGAYSCTIKPINQFGMFSENNLTPFIDRAKSYSNDHPLREMTSISARRLDFDNWSIKNNAKFLNA